MEKNKLSSVEWFYKISLNLFGLFLSGFGIVLTIQAGLGASPWEVFQLGMTKYLPITLGQASQIIAFILLLFTWYKGVTPGVGTVLNAYFMGFFIDLSYKFNIQTPESIFLQILMLAVSIIIFALGLVLSLKSKIGVGTRDALMEYLTCSSDLPVSTIRACIEIFALIGGILLNRSLRNPFGIGTIVVALTVGHLISFFAKHLKYDFSLANHYTFKDMLSKFDKKIKQDEVNLADSKGEF